ncbi:MAG: EpsG family protein [Elusimicrobiaceae bacterium]|nr:EpsG family protein [Elusimicrobiaceae bacterium]
MQYLWQYYLLITVIFVQGLLLLRWGKFGKWAFSVLCFVELTFLAGFRSWNIGNDTMRYVQMFILSLNFPELIKTHMEQGYLLYNRFLGIFTSNPQMLLLTSSVLAIGAWLNFIRKYSVSILLSTLLFVISNYGMILTMIRQEIAICIVLLAIPFIIKRQLFPFLFCCILASTFHTSAILAISLYFVYLIPFKIKYLLFILAGTLFAFIFLAPILNTTFDILGRYESYMGSRLLGEETKLASILKTLVQGSVAIFCYISYKYFYLSKKIKQGLISIDFLLWCCIFSACIQFISIRGTLLERLTLYFSIFNLISIPFFVRCYPKNIRIFIALGVVCTFIVINSVIFVYRPEWNHVLPFEFCFK